MDIDIEIYLKNLRGFFNSGQLSPRKKAKLSKKEINRLMNEIELIAIRNYKDKKDPTLSRAQMIEVLSKINETPPHKRGMNNTYFEVHNVKGKFMKGYGEISIPA